MEKNIDDRREPELHVGAALNAVEAAMSGNAWISRSCRCPAGNPLADVMTGARPRHHVYEAWWRVERSFECVKTRSPMPGDPQTIALPWRLQGTIWQAVRLLPKTEMARALNGSLPSGCKSREVCARKRRRLPSLPQSRQKIERISEPGKE